MAKYTPQPGLFDDDAEYRAFVEKFKPKKTTDDCYTPPAVYDALLKWFRENLPLFPPGANVLRPFWPGADFRALTYGENDVVVDNPPFSILAKIVDFYLAHRIPFLLFAPHLTLFGLVGPRKGVTALVAGANLIYANGAKVSTSFVTNMDDPETMFRTVPDLKLLVEEASKSSLEPAREVVPKAWPPELVSASLLGKVVVPGVEWIVQRRHCRFVRKLQNSKHGVFGGGFLLSRSATAERTAVERVAAERAAAERAAIERGAAERAAAERVELSESEKKTVRELGR